MSKAMGRSISELFKCRAGRRSRAVGGGQGNDSADGQGKAIEPHGLPSPSSSWRPPLPINRARTQSAPFIGAHRPLATGPPALQALAFGSQSPVSCLFPSLSRQQLAGAFFPFHSRSGRVGIRPRRHCHHHHPKHPGLLLAAGQQRCLALPLLWIRCPVPVNRSLSLSIYIYKAEQARSGHVVRRGGRQEGPAEAALRQRVPPRRRVRAVPGEQEGRRGRQPVQQPRRRRRHGGGGGAHDLHASPDRHGLPQGRVGGRRGRVPGGVPRGHGGGRRQGHHQHSCLGALGVQEQEQPEQHQPQGSLQGLHLRHGGHRGAGDVAGAGHTQPPMGLSRRSLPALPVRLDAGGAHRVAGEAVGARAGGRGGGHTGVDRPSWHVHDAPDVLGRRGGAVLADGHAAVAVVDNYCPNCPHVQFKASAKAWQPEDKTKKFRSSLSSRSF